MHVCCAKAPLSRKSRAVGRRRAPEPEWSLTKSQLPPKERPLACSAWLASDVAVAYPTLRAAQPGRLERSRGKTRDRKQSLLPERLDLVAAVSEVHQTNALTNK